MQWLWWVHVKVATYVVVVVGEYYGRYIYGGGGGGFVLE